MSADLIKRTIPSTGEEIPVIGLGTYKSFDCRLSSDKRHSLTRVLKLFIEAGGTVIDSSPMYGQAEAVVGGLLKDLNAREKVWLASKVWTRGARSGIDEMDKSYRLMNAGSLMELMQIHNLVDWETHYKTLRQWKEAGKIRYIGISHYSSSSFDEMIQILQAYPGIDFIQYIHSMRNHVAENRLLPFCRDHGVATMANRPLEQGSLLRRRESFDLPPWASNYSIGSWSQFFLKFIISHPDVTCVIPATSNLAHMADNLNAGRGELANEKTRQDMIAWIGR